MNKIAHIHLSTWLVKRAAGPSLLDLVGGMSPEDIDRFYGSRGQLAGAAAAGYGGAGAALGGGIGALIQALRRSDQDANTPADKKHSIGAGLGWGAGIGGGLGALGGAFAGSAFRDRLAQTIGRPGVTLSF